MKFCKVTVFLTLLMALCLPAVAQGVRLDIPFNFIAAGASMPAGHYRVEPVFTTQSVAWRIFNQHASVMMLTYSIESPRKAHRTSLIFAHAGGLYSLVQIWPEAYAGRDLTQSKVKQALIAQDVQYVEVGAE